MICAQVKSVRADKKVIDFLTNCGNKNLQYLLVPARLDSALAQMDTDRDGEFSLSEWEDAIETALSNKLAQRAAAREAQRKAAAKEIAEFTGEFLNAARHCFEMIDKDGGGTLSTAEIVKAVKEDAARTRRPTTARPSTCEACGDSAIGPVVTTFFPRTGSHYIPQDLRRGKFAVPPPPAAPQEGVGGA